MMVLGRHNEPPLPVFMIRDDNLGAALLKNKVNVPFENTEEQVVEPADSQNGVFLWSYFRWKS
jgi:hypothetical protein